jgi:hypothetical protein
MKQLTLKQMLKAVTKSDLTDAEAAIIKWGLLTGRTAHSKMKQLFPAPEGYYKSSDISENARINEWKASLLDQDIDEVDNILDLRCIAKQYMQRLDEQLVGQKRKWSTLKYTLAHDIRDNVAKRSSEAQGRLVLSELEGNYKSFLQKSKYGVMRQIVNQFLEEDKQFLDLHDEGNMRSINSDYWQTQPTYDSLKFESCPAHSNDEERRRFEAAKHQHICQLEKQHRVKSTPSK